MQTKLKITATILALTAALQAFAYTPRAQADKYGLFLDSSPYAIPKDFWKAEDRENLNRVLKPYGANQRSILSVQSFKDALGGTFENVAYSPIDHLTEMQTYRGYPSIYEYRSIDALRRGNKITGTNNGADPENQCTAFAKMMLRNSTWTGNWYAEKGRGTVMQQKSAGSDAHRGKAVIFLSDPTKSYKSQGSDAHVGIFLGYGDNGFWIADENFGGTSLKPTGEIRKHFIKSLGINGGNSAYNADKYYFLDIR